MGEGQWLELEELVREATVQYEKETGLVLPPQLNSLSTLEELLLTATVQLGETAAAETAAAAAAAAAAAEAPAAAAAAAAAAATAAAAAAAAAVATAAAESHDARFEADGT